MSVKNDMSKLVHNLEDGASWNDVKDAVMIEYKKATGDATADSLAAVVLCLVFVAASVFWVSSQ